MPSLLQPQSSSSSIWSFHQVYCGLVEFAVAAYLWIIVGLSTIFGLLIYGHKEFLYLGDHSVNPLLQFAASMFRHSIATFNITGTPTQEIMERAHPRDLDYAFSLFTFALILAVAIAVAVAMLTKACAKPTKKKLEIKLLRRKMELPGFCLVETEVTVTRS